MNILIIPDAHSTPEGTTDRFTLLGEFIVQERPDAVVCLGDFLDMRSLSSYDMGKGSAEGQRVKRDLDAGLRDLEALMAPIEALRTSQKAGHRKRYRPPMYFTEGNHEYRMAKYLNDNPTLIGTLSLDEFYSHWDAVVPFKETFLLEGVAFAHYFPNKMGRAIGGVNAARSITLKNMVSSVCGHSHEWDWSWFTRRDGTRGFGCVAGWYGEESHDEEWSTGTDHTWVNGVTMLYSVKNGCPGKVAFISQDELRRTASV